MTTVSLPDFSVLAKWRCPETIADLTAVIRNLGCSRFENFPVLEAAIGGFPGFLTRTLPFIWSQAVGGNEALPKDIPILSDPGSISLTQKQCLAILASAFLCAFPGRVSINCLSSRDLPSINLDELYCDGGNDDAQTAKLHMLFHYFDRCRERLERRELLDHPIRFLRRRATDSAGDTWINARDPLLPPVVQPLGRSIDEAKDMLRVDFANMIIGGGAIAYGCVQEEIMFCVCPELIVSRLVCTVMQSDEAIVIFGTEQFSTPDGYGFSLKCGGAFEDPTPFDHQGVRQSSIVAIDALDFRRGGTQTQFAPEKVLRELTKAFAGFDVPEAPENIATGNWGCGAFRGDPELKSLIQWAAASRAKKRLNYFPWNDASIGSNLPRVAAKLMQKGWTVGHLSDFLLRSLKPGSSFSQVETAG